MSTGPAIEIVPIGDEVAPEIVRRLADRLEEVLRATVTVGRALEVPAEAADGAEPAEHVGSAAPAAPAASAASAESAAPATHSSDPVNAGRLLDALIARDGGEASDPGRWALGVTARPLHARPGNRVFGLATVGGAWAIIGTADLLGSGDATTDSDRILKEAIHEIGHIAGLDHCPSQMCVMRSSANAAEIDAKPATFCVACEDLLGPSPLT